MGKKRGGKKSRKKNRTKEEDEAGGQGQGPKEGDGRDGGAGPRSNKGDSKNGPCDCCGKAGAPSQCPKCGTGYRDEACQQKGWKRHKRVCAARAKERNGDESDTCEFAALLSELSIVGSAGPEAGEAVLSARDPGDLITHMQEEKEGKSNEDLHGVEDGPDLTVMHGDAGDTLTLQMPLADGGQGGEETSREETSREMNDQQAIPPPTLEESLAPLRELEDEIAELPDDLPWAERRAFYVRLYRYEAQLQAECSPNEVSTPVLLPAGHAAEQEAVRQEGDMEARVQPHCRWGCDFRDIYGEVDDDVAGLSQGMVDALRAAEQALNADFYAWDQGNQGTEMAIFEPPLRFEVGQRVMSLVEEGWVPATIVSRCYRVFVETEGDDEECGYQLAPYQMLVDRAVTRGGYEQWLIYSSLDDDQCIRAQSTEEAAAHPPPTDPSGERRGAALLLLFATFWKMDNGYTEVDIGGLLDIEVPPGTIGRGLIDLELTAGMNHHCDLYMSERCARKIQFRLQAYQSFTLARDAEEEKAKEGKSKEEGGEGEERDSSDDEDEEEFGSGISAPLSLDDSALLRYVRRDGMACSNYDVMAAFWLNVAAPHLRAEFVSTPNPFLCSSCGAQRSGKLAPFHACSRCRRAYFCGSACMKKAWKAHKPSCEKPSMERGVAAVCELLRFGSHKARSSDGYSDEAIELSLKLSRNIPIAAHSLLVHAKTGGYIVMASTRAGQNRWRAISKSLKVLNGFRVRTKDFERLERVMGTFEAHQAKILEEDGKEYEKEAAYHELLPLCDEIFETLLPVLDCASLARRTDGPNSISNRELFCGVHRSMREPVAGCGVKKGGTDNTPLFLLLVDDLLSGFHHMRRTESLASGGFSTNEVKRRAKRAKKLCRQVWIRYNKILEGPEHCEGDAEVLDLGRTRFFIRFNAMMKRQAEMEGREKYTGKWEWVILGHKIVGEIERSAAISAATSDIANRL
jgi:hypothetical protein